MQIISRMLDQEVLVIEVGLSRIDASNSKLFRERLYDALMTNKKVLLCLGAVEFMDSSGLGVIISCQKRVREYDGDLRIAEPSIAVMGLFKLMRLDRLFQIYSSKLEAMNSFKNVPILK
jgi:anti-sigma B factor antagonist